MANNQFFTLEGKTALISGGASGIGLEVARRFSIAQAQVVIVDIKDGSAQASEIGADFVVMNVADANSVEEVMQEVTARHGRLDILVNNAGINGADGVAITESDPSLTTRLFEINMMGVYNGLKYGPEYMNNGGSIINTASLAASFVFPGSGPYSASKSAVANMTTMAAAELARRRIRVNAVAPSFVRTPMSAEDLELFKKMGRYATYAGRIAEPEEVAAVFHFLASDDSRYINGQVINVDGGMANGFTEEMIELIARAE